MKREAFGSTKMKLLCQKLGVRVYVSVGILESLWALTAREAPQGNIGKLSDEEIALSLDWDGEPERLVASLVESRWLERSKTHRLIVHDWHDHADEAVKKKLIRNSLEFLTVSKMSRHVATKGAKYRDTDRLPEPEPVPGPEPVPEKEKAKALARSVPPEELAGTLPLVDGSEFSISKSQIHAWSQAYPGVDVKIQLRQAKAWLEANPTRRKTQRGIIRFAVNWLDKAQNRSGANGNQIKNSGSSEDGGNGPRVKTGSSYFDSLCEPIVDGA